MELKQYEIDLGRKLATVLTEIKAIDWNDTTVIVAKKGDTIKVLQEFSDMVFIQCENWDFEVVTNPENIEIIKQL